MCALMITIPEVDWMSQWSPRLITEEMGSQVRPSTIIDWRIKYCNIAKLNCFTIQMHKINVMLVSNKLFPYWWPRRPAVVQVCWESINEEREKVVMVEAYWVDHVSTPMPCWLQEKKGLAVSRQCQAMCRWMWQTSSNYLTGTRIITVCTPTGWNFTDKEQYTGLFQVVYEQDEMAFWYHCSGNLLFARGDHSVKATALKAWEVLFSNVGRVVFITNTLCRLHGYMNSERVVQT